MATRATHRRRYAPRLPPEQRREQLLDAALVLVASDGMAAVTMEAVARQVGVTKPVVYGAFSDRGALLKELLQREEQRALAQLARAIPADAMSAERDPDALLHDGMLAFLQAVEASPERWRMILMPVDGHPPLVREHVQAGRRTIARQLREAVEWAVRGREGLAGLDTELLALSLLALSENAAMLVLRDPARFSPDRLASYAGSFAGLLPRR